MKIINYLGCTKEEVESKKFNIWIGISLGNKYFTKENIEKYILWALENTKEDIIVVIGDRLQAINLEVLDKYNKTRAWKVALRKGDEKEKEIKEIVEKLPEEKKKLIKIVKFKDVTNTKYYEFIKEILEEAYKTNSQFKEYITNIVKNNPKASTHKLSDVEIDSLAQYIILELPIYLNGCYLNKYYTCTIYPGRGLIDELEHGLHTGNLFPEIGKKLNLKNQVGILEGYIE
ncbi:MAG: tRNA-dependent cyclodipeptide synthase [Nanoarchaeota archaeon]